MHSPAGSCHGEEVSGGQLAVQSDVTWLVDHPLHRLVKSVVLTDWLTDELGLEDQVEVLELLPAVTLAYQA